MKCSIIPLPTFPCRLKTTAASARRVDPTDGKAVPRMFRLELSSSVGRPCHPWDLMVTVASTARQGIDFLA